MKKVNETSGYTWQSLLEYFETQIASILDSLNSINDDTPENLAIKLKEISHRQLNLLRWYLPLVIEMRHCEDMQLVTPVFGVGIIRLSCRQCDDNQARSDDFAWITSREEGKYELSRIDIGKTKSFEPLWKFEGDLIQTVEKIKELVHELCV